MVKCAATKVMTAGLIIGSLFAAPSAFGNTITVTNTFDSGPGSLRNAIAGAAAGDTIVVNVSGTIALTSGPLVIRKDLSITGPGPGTAAITGTAAARVLTIADTGMASVTIAGLTIRDGHADMGGGILNGGRLTLTDVVVSGNSADFYGGGIYSRGTLSISRSIVSGNAAGYYGGGLYTDTGSTLAANNLTLSGNSAAIGGGMSNHDGTISFNNSTIRGNAAGNTHGGSGGGIHNGGLGGTVTVDNSTIAYNTASSEGGAIYIGSGTLVVRNSTVSYNSCSCASGGCSGGGGLYNHSSQVSVINATFFDNVSTQGGSITSLYGTTTLKNSILARGASGTNCYTYMSAAIVSDGHNLSDDESCLASLAQSNDANGVPAELSPAGLRDNGGPTETIAPLPSSPAVDAVPVEACGGTASAGATDQRGVARPQRVACDMGALELIVYPTALTLVVAAPASIVAGSPGPLILSTTLTSQGTHTPIAGGSVAFSVDGVNVGLVLTDSIGVAAFSYDPSRIDAGAHTVAASFGTQTIGDVAFDASTTTTTTFQVEPSPYVASVQPPIKADGSSVFNLHRGVVPVKFTLTYNGQPTCEVSATIALSRTTGTSGAISESIYALPADSGSTFRVDANACQYIYNLATGSLGTGTYTAYMLVGGNIVGRATFGLQ